MSDCDIFYGGRYVDMSGLDLRLCRGSRAYVWPDINICSVLDISICLAGHKYMSGWT